MNLLYVLSEFPPAFGGGISTVYGQLLPKLVKQGHCVTVILACESQCDQPAYCWQGVQVQPLRRSYLTQALQLMRAWRQHAFLHTFLPTAWAAWLQCRFLDNIDLIEVTDWALLFVPWLVQERRRPVVVALHGSCAQVDWHINPNRRMGEGSLVRFLEAALLPGSDQLLANSHLNARFWERHCGVSPAVIPPTFTETGPLPSTAASSGRGLVIGRLQNWKGVEPLCRALRLLPDHQVDWIGADTSWQEGNEKTSAYLRRHYPDVVDGQLQLFDRQRPDSVHLRLRQAAYLCVPSLWDVFNVTVIEAMAAGVPVICSREAGGAMLIEDGQTGFLFDPAHPCQLASSIQSVLNLGHEERIQLVRRASQHIMTTISPELIANLHSQLYSSVVNSFAPRKASEWMLSALLNGIGHAIPLEPGLLA